jgi:TetR/AcrR family transcriptional regulator
VARRDPEQTERSLLDAAEREFAGHGLAGARLARIARAAGTSERMVHHYFGGKQGLYEAVLRRVSDELVRQLLPAVTAHADGEPAAAYEATIRACFDAVRGHPTWARLMAHESLDYFRTVHRVTAGPDERFLPVIVPTIQRGQAAGVLREGPAPVLGFGLAATLSLLYPLWHANLLGGAGRAGGLPAAGDEAALVDGLLSVVMRGVLTR